MRNCAWKILRGASEASTESVTVGALAPKTENDDNRQIATQKKFLTLEREPILPHVALLQETVVKEKCHAGLVTDGDADRIGAVAEDGSFVDSHKCMCVLLNWLLVYKKWPGDVVRAFNTTGMMDRIAAKYGRKLYETSIGFKYIADLMMEHEILIDRKS